MAANLTVQVRNIVEGRRPPSPTATCTQKITVDAKGEILELKDVINTMVDQLNSFAAEVTRVAKEVGTEGKLGGQANVKGVSGTWKDLTDNVNAWPRNLTVQLRDMSKVATAVANGDLVAEDHGRRQRRDPPDQRRRSTHGGPAQLVRRGSDARREGSRHRREARRPGRGEGRLGHVEGPDRQRQRPRRRTSPTQVRNIAKVTTAVANGDLSQKITVDAQGRNPRAEEHHQRHGGPAQLVRGGGDARREGGRHGRQARRSGRGAKASRVRGRTSPTT